MMYYINTNRGFVQLHRGLFEEPEVRFMTDVRLATPFSSFEEADHKAKDAVLLTNRRYYAILSTI